jgi:uncharacterized membrane protein YbhN (UPF0104 family)
MQDVTSFTARSTRVSNGWSKIGIVISLLIVAAAGVTLFHLLGDIDLGKVFDAVRAKPSQSIVFSAGFVALCYVTLTFYDFFSLHTIGHGHVPYRIAALASFTSYSIGHNLGATVFTAGAVRWRIYSSWGLSVIDVAKMAFVTGLTFWLGNTVVLAICFIIEPEAASAVDQLPQWINRSLGILGLVIIAAYVLWLLPRPRVVGRNGWSITLPNAPLTGVQIAIGLVDLGVGGLAIYYLLPPEPAVDFITVLVIYVTATLLGFLSHAPGSLGVFEVAMLIALPQFPKEEMLASLLIFRCLYFVLPLCIAICLMATRELWLATRK